MFDDLKVYNKAKEDRKRYLKTLADVTKVMDRSEKTKDSVDKNGLVKRLEVKIAACDLTMKEMKQSSFTVKILTLFR